MSESWSFATKQVQAGATSDPTTGALAQYVLEQRVAALEGGLAAVAFASGQAAETLAIL